MTDTYCYALCHNNSERWLLYKDNGSVAWTDHLHLANVWSPDDIEAEDYPDIDESVMHWVALTWEQYCELMQGCPEGLCDWLNDIDIARIP